MTTSRRFRTSLRPESTTLERRDLLAIGASAYVSQLYYGLLERAPDPRGFEALVDVASNGPQGRDDAARIVLGSAEYRDRVIDDLYRELLDRDPDPVGRNAFQGLIAARGSDAARVAILGSDEYFNRVTSDSSSGFANIEYVTTLIDTELGRPMTLGEQRLLIGPTRPDGTFNGPLDRGVSRSAIASFIVNSAAADRRFATEEFVDLVLRAPTSGEINPAVSTLRRGQTPEDAIRAIVTSTAFSDRWTGVTDDALTVMADDPDLSRFVDAIESAGLADMLRNGGPFTIFAPTDAAFDGTFFLTGELERAAGAVIPAAFSYQYHIVPNRVASVAIAGAGTLPTLEGNAIGIRDVLTTPTINGADLVGTPLLATNAVIYPINELLSPPSGDLVASLGVLGDHETFLNILDAAGKTDVLRGPGPFTVFAPNDAAFQAFGQQRLDRLLASPALLERFYRNHVIEGSAESTADLADGRSPRVQPFNGRYVIPQLFDNRPPVIDVENIPATNGLIQSIDEVIEPGCVGVACILIPSY